MLLAVRFLKVEKKPRGRPPVGVSQAEKPPRLLSVLAFDETVIPQPARINDIHRRRVDRVAKTQGK
tara:strand:- start:195 stop:392 length:198 start_codon:yes stop_codon:yes gene_type:complete